jgi:diphthamide synthase (EF-2-diphthine--ammonia ligase)
MSEAKEKRYRVESVTEHQNAKPNPYIGRNVDAARREKKRKKVVRKYAKRLPHKVMEQVCKTFNKGAIVKRNPRQRIDNVRNRNGLHVIATLTARDMVKPLISEDRQTAR